MLAVRSRVFILTLVLAGLVTPRLAAQQSGGETSSQSSSAKKKASTTKKPTSATARKPTSTATKKPASTKKRTTTAKKKHVTPIRVTRVKRAFVASAALKPMARQLLQDRGPAAYAGVEKYARAHNDEAGSLAWLVAGYAHVLDRQYPAAIEPLKNARAHAGELGDYVDYYLASAYCRRRRSHPRGRGSRRVPDEVSGLAAGARCHGGVRRSAGLDRP